MLFISNMEIILREKPWFQTTLQSPQLQDVTIRDLYIFYLLNDNIYKILPIITSCSNISIRVLDWFVTNFSKKRNTMYELKNKNLIDEKYFNVYLHYKNELKEDRKKLFDPFCRKHRIKFQYESSKWVVTTIGQLNFFRWAIKYEVLNYVEKNLQTITRDMVQSNNEQLNIQNQTTNDDQIFDKTTRPKKLPKQTKSKSKKLSKSNSSSNESHSISDTKQLINETIHNAANNDKTTSENITDSEKIRKKRHELSTSASKRVNVQKYTIELTFD